LQTKWYRRNMKNQINARGGITVGEKNIPKRRCAKGTPAAASRPCSSPKKKSRRSGSCRACPPFRYCRRKKKKRKSFCTLFKFPKQIYPRELTRIEKIEQKEICTPPIPPESPKNDLIKNEICGLIQQKCNGEFVEYWRSIDLTSIQYGSVTVINSSECTMTVKADTNGDGIPDITLFTITDRDQTKAVTLRSITSLQISCEGDSGATCSGKFCLTLYYRS
jgi:hypothetical protein